LGHIAVAVVHRAATMHCCVDTDSFDTRNIDAAGEDRPAVAVASRLQAQLREQGDGKVGLGDDIRYKGHDTPGDA
jgi:hypothetical protein